MGGQPIDIVSPRTAFGELQANPLEPQAQIDSIYGVLDSDHEVFEATGGTVTTENRMFKCSTGVSLGGYGTIRSKRALRYRPGQGAVVRFTAMFDPDNAVPLSTQLAGAFVAENGLFFGYDGEEFGLMRQTGGAIEIRTLTVTTPDGTGGNATVTLNGVGHTVPITGGGTVQDDAAEIAAFAYAGWRARQVDDTVIFVAFTGVGAKDGAFTYAAPVDGVGTFARTVEGSDNTDTWTYQESWNIDQLDGQGDNRNPSRMTLDKSKLNVFQIQFQWLGGGRIVYSVEGPNGDFIPVHMERYANANVQPSLFNPTLKVGWAAASLGSSGTDITVRGASGAMFIEGPVRARRNPRGTSNSKTGVGTTWTSIVSIRAGYTFKDFINQREIVPFAVSAAVDGNKPAELSIVRNAVLGGTPNWQPVADDSSAEVDTAGTTLTNGEEIMRVSLGKTGSEVIHMVDCSLRIDPGDQITVAVRATSGTTDAVASITWGED